jgi:hypothetical protein
MALRSKVLWVPVTAAVILALVAAVFLVRVRPVEGAPAQTPWQELGPAYTANP